ncbi:hypothetical protein GBAR_LOCUS8553 [Geodia barretti]|uniref:Uncharacterized protein n=1 Tax=Geodia barretti TaxID=519541 RepID=A0AA35WH57_GEOBA|nr:hypothetical protein GBAR_LOCUS8553 [Geodia barretti]
MSDLAIPAHSEQHCVMALICSISKRAISGNYIASLANSPFFHYFPVI